MKLNHEIPTHVRISMSIMQLWQERTRPIPGCEQQEPHKREVDVFSAAAAVLESYLDSCREQFKIEDLQSEVTVADKRPSDAPAATVEAPPNPFDLHSKLIARAFTSQTDSETAHFEAFRKAWIAAPHAASVRCSPSTHYNLKAELKAAMNLPPNVEIDLDSLNGLKFVLDESLPNTDEDGLPYFVVE
jgi:hypothetical protein